MLQTDSNGVRREGEGPRRSSARRYSKSVALTLLFAAWVALLAFGLAFWIVGPLLFKVPWGAATLASFVAVAIAQALAALGNWYNRKIEPEVSAARRALGLDPPAPAAASTPERTQSCSRLH